MRLSRCSLLLAFAACHSSAAPTSAANASPMPQRGLSCAKIGEDLVAAIPAGANAPQDAKDKLVGVVSQSCEADAWSADAKSCIDAAKTTADLTACNDKLTPAQQDGMNQRLSAALGGPATSSSRSAGPPAPAAAPPPPMSPGANSPSPSPPMPASTQRRSKAPAKPAGNSGGDPCDGSE